MNSDDFGLIFSIIDTYSFSQRRTWPENGQQKRVSGKTIWVMTLVNVSFSMLYSHNFPFWAISQINIVFYSMLSPKHKLGIELPKVLKITGFVF